MVSLTTLADMAVATCLAAQPQPLWSRLGPEDRARVFAALGGLILLGVASVLLAWWGARATRRYINRDTKPVRPPIPDDDWALRRLYPDDPDASDPQRSESEGRDDA